MLRPNKASPKWDELYVVEDGDIVPVERSAVPRLSSSSQSQKKNGFSGLCIFSSGGLNGNALCYFHHGAAQNKLPSMNMPFHKIASWFEQNGSLKSFQELMQQHWQQISRSIMYNINTANHEYDRVASAQPKTASTTVGMDTLNPLITTSSTSSIQTSPHTHINILSVGEGTYMLITVNKLNTPLKPKPFSTLISNCAGYWVSDYCHVGGFHQVIFFPVRNNNSPMKKPHNIDEEQFLLKGAILTDGLDLWISSSSNRFGNSLKVELVSVSSRIYKGYCTMIHLPSIHQSVASLKRQASPRRKASTQSNHSSTAPIDESFISKNISSTLGDVKGWRKTLEQSLSKQLRQRHREQEYHRCTQSGRDFLLRKNQQALQQLIQSEFWRGLYNALGMKLSGLRYCVYPRMSTRMGFHSVSLWIEVDLQLLHHVSKRQASVASPNKEFALQNAHVSCTPGRKDNTVVAQSQSGVIPSLYYGDHVTVLLSVNLDGLVLPSCVPHIDAVDGDRNGITLSLNIIGTSHDLLDFMSAEKMSTSKGNASGMVSFVLGSFLVPYHVILQAPFNNRLYRLESNPHANANRPFAVFECREPYFLKVDVSCCPKFSLTKVLETLNQQVCGQCAVHVDRGTDQAAGDDSALCFAIFALAPSEVAGLVPLIISQLPGQPKILM